MPYLIEMPLEEGGTLVFETDEEALGPVRAAVRPGEIVATVGETLESAIERIRPFVTSIATKLRSTEIAPSALTLEFGLSVTTSAGFVVAKGEATANIRVTLAWERE